METQASEKNGIALTPEEVEMINANYEQIRKSVKICLFRKYGKLFNDDYIVIRALSYLPEIIKTYDPEKSDFVKYACFRCSRMLQDEQRRESWVTRSINRARKVVDEIKDDLTKKKGFYLEDELGGEIEERGISGKQKDNIVKYGNANFFFALFSSFVPKKENASDTLCSLPYLLGDRAVYADSHEDFELEDLCFEARKMINRIYAKATFGDTNVFLKEFLIDVLFRSILPRVKGEEWITLKKVGKMYGVSESRVSQLVAKFLPPIFDKLLKGDGVNRNHRRGKCLQAV